MIDAKKELQYRLAIRMLEHLSEKGLLSAKELAYAKGLAREKYAPQTVREYKRMVVSGVCVCCAITQHR